VETFEEDNDTYEENEKRENRKRKETVMV